MRGWALLFLCAASAVAGEELPLPTDKTIILSRQGTTYYVEGRRTIGPGTEISIQKETRIVGREGGVLVVEGSLQIHGIAGGEVMIEDLVIEPAARFEEIRLDTVLFLGGGLKADKKTVAGSIVVENTDFAAGVPLDLTMTSGQVTLLNSTFMEPVRLRGAAPEVKGGRCSLKADFNGCFYTQRHPRSQRNAFGGFEKGLFVTGVPDLLVRNCHVAGDRVEFVDCDKLTFDGNKSNVSTLLFRQTRPGGFKDTRIQKTDFYFGTIVFEAPAGKEQVPVDKCWFQGLTKKDEVRKRFFKDGTDDPKCGVVATFLKIMERPLELAGPAN